MLLICLILLAFFGLWARDLGYPSLSGDESFVTILTSQPTGEILQRLNSDEPYPPAYYLLRHAWHKLVGGRPEYVVRFPSLLIGLLVLSLTYQLGRSLGLGRLTAVIPVIVLGFNPQMIVHIREARMVEPIVASLALFVLIGLRFDRLPGRSQIWIAAVASVLALLTHYFNSLFVAAVGLWGLLTMAGALRRRWIVSQAIAWLIFAAWLPLMGRGFFNPASLNQGKTWSFVLAPWDTLARLIKVATIGYRVVQTIAP